MNIVKRKMNEFFKKLNKVLPDKEISNEKHILDQGKE